ncbi:MAG: 50S ribosomal protein L11 methyltransferase, partial [Saprospiraceae bacterium]
MKKRLIHIFQQIAKNDFIWSILKPFAKTFHGLYLKRLNLEYTQKILGFQNIFPDLTVRMGPFKSMKYPKFEAVCSTILPKLIGTYEMELANIIEDVKNKSYETIIDIGCAEGYYAVGFAMTTSNAQIIAYDIDPDARELCLEMAKLNLVEDKIIIKDGIDENLLIAEVQG